MAQFSARLTSSQIDNLQEFVKKSKSATQVKIAQIILLVDKGEAFQNIKLITGISRSRAFEIRKTYLQKGVSVFDVKPRGMKELLTKNQLQEIIEIVRTKNPSESGASRHHEFWNTGLLSRFIEDKYQVKYKSKTSYYLLFRKAAFTYHKPGQVYQKHDPAQVLAWKKQHQKDMDTAWNDPDTVLLCEDEMKLSTQTTFQRIWLPKGEYPQVKVSNKKESRSIYGFLNIKTGQQHAFKTLWQNMYITKDQLIKIRRMYPKQKLLILWDGPGSHRGKEVTTYLQQDGNMETIFFPPYSPQENPQEHVWKEGRSKVTHNKFIEDIDLATDSFVEYLNTTKFRYKLLNFGPL